MQWIKYAMSAKQIENQLLAKWNAANLKRESNIPLYEFECVFFVFALTQYDAIFEWYWDKCITLSCEMCSLSSNFCFYLKQWHAMQRIEHQVKRKMPIAMPSIHKLEPQFACQNRWANRTLSNEHSRYRTKSASFTNLRAKFFHKF